jgi:phosphoglucomutase
MKELELYRLWLEKATADDAIQKELKAMEGDEATIYECFFKELEFGTGGLRGILGAGTNRMNYYTVRKATQGFANYLLSSGRSGISIAVSYDSRINSKYFAQVAAEVLAGNGIQVYLYSELMPTPMLSYAVRTLGCNGGIMVTASHNPAKYNGYKVYGADGCQVTAETADAILECINKTDMFDGITYANFDEALKDGRIHYIVDDIIDRYIAKVKEQSIHPEVFASSELKVVYTPLNGTGNKPVRRILKEIGVKNVTIVPEQELPDGNFTTCPYPNPEFREALELGLALCKKEDADLLIATDPDCDRVGIAVKDGDDYVLFSGNEIGAMLLDYIAKERIANGTMPQNPLTVKTIVTSDLVKEIAKKYNIELIEVLTGFKYIGEQIGFLEEKGEENRYIFGFEESYGFLAGTYVRDKDAVVTSMLICEMAAFYRSKGVSLVEARRNMYKEYGYFCNMLDNFTFEGSSGMKKMKSIMDSLRENPPKEIGGVSVNVVSDYQYSVTKDLVNNSTTQITLPKSDVLCFYLEDGGSVIIRPSGTEPKIKVYYSAKGESEDAAKALQKKYSDDFMKVLGF